MKLVLTKQFLLTTAILLAGTACTNENTEGLPGNPSSPSDGDAATRREVVVTIKNKLTVTPAGTKADPIATTEENKISSLDIYVFGSATEDGTYTFQERFAYRENPTEKPVPAGASSIDLTQTGDGKEASVSMKLQKGLFVKLYAIANQPTLVGPGGEPPFTPLVLTNPGQQGTTVQTVGVPTETDFLTFHSPLLEATTPTHILNTPLPMSGANTVPTDLTDFEAFARIQASFKLTRTVARFDVVNDATTSRFTITNISMGNARKGTTFFPIASVGTAPAAPGDLITLPARTFTGMTNANAGTTPAAFYSYPSPKDDKGYIILTGTYKMNNTETPKTVSYQIPFEQEVNGSGSYIEVAPNHRYTIAITKADDYHLDFNLTVADWTDEGNVDGFDPTAVLTLLETKQTPDNPNTFDLATATASLYRSENSKVQAKVSCPGTVTATAHPDWLTAESRSDNGITTFTFTLNNRGTTDTEGTVTIANELSQSTNLNVKLHDFTAPTQTSDQPLAFNIQDNTTQVPEVLIAGKCIGGCEIIGLPEWITVENQTDNNNASTTDADTYSFKLKLIVNDQNKDKFPIMPKQTILNLRNKRATSEATLVTIVFSENIQVSISSADESNPMNPYENRAGTGGKTMKALILSMFPLTPEYTYDNQYCPAQNNGNTWLQNSTLTSNGLTNNRHNYTLNIVVDPSSGTDANYQLHRATIDLKSGSKTQKTLIVWRGASFYGYPVNTANGSGSPYYSAVKMTNRTFWAPVNVGATSIPTSVATTGDITLTCGNLFQWGRKCAFSASSDMIATTNTLVTNENLANFEGNDTWKNKFIASPNPPKDWLTTKDNTLWNSNTEQSPTKTASDPCPPGWRVPTKTEWEGIGAGNNRITIDNTTKLATITGDNGIALVLPATGYRFDQSGIRGGQGIVGTYWTSSVSVSGNNACNAHFTNGTALCMMTDERADGFAMRCIKE